jgi:hypothetical protein
MALSSFGEIRMRLLIIGFVSVLAVLKGCGAADRLPGDRLRQPAPPATTQMVLTLPTAPASTPPSNCPHSPLGGFDEVWRDEQVWPRLGCAVAPAEAVTGTEVYLCCMHSIWLRERALFVAVQDAGLRWAFVADESGLPSDAPSMVGPDVRSCSCFEATGRHGWLACSPSWAHECDGLSRTDETAFSGAMQQFEGGWLLWNGDVCFVLFSDGTWTMF